MKILFVSAVLPYPPKSGGQIRMYNLLKRLSKEHEITLVSFIREENGREHAKELRFCKKVVMVMRGRGMRPSYVWHALTGKYPLLLATYDNKKMLDEVSALLGTESFDIVHLEPFYVWPSIPKTTVPIVISEHNVEYSVYEEYVRRFKFVFLRPFLFLDVVKLRLWEEKVWQKAHGLTAVSAHDAAVMKRIGVSVAVVPNGVDLAEFPYRPAAKGKGPVLLFVGDFRWFPNQDALERLLSSIWPHVKKKYPDASLRIVGRHLNPRLIHRIQKVHGEVLADVPNIVAQYHAAHVLVAPHAIAGGTKFKMLEAMATGLPVVTSQDGMAGLAAEKDVHYLEATSAADYVAQIGKIWENRKVREALTKRARQLVEEQYSWKNISGELARVWKETHEKHH